MSFRDQAATWIDDPFPSIGIIAIIDQSSRSTFALKITSKFPRITGFAQCKVAKIHRI